MAGEGYPYRTDMAPLTASSALDVLELRGGDADRAHRMLRLIERSLPHSDRMNDDTIRDVTAKRVNRQRQIIERMERMIGELENRGA